MPIRINQDIEKEPTYRVDKYERIIVKNAQPVGLPMLDELTVQTTDMADRVIVHDRDAQFVWINRKSVADCGAGDCPDSESGLPTCGDSSKFRIIPDDIDGLTAGDQITASYNEPCSLIVVETETYGSNFTKWHPTYFEFAGESGLFIQEGTNVIPQFELLRPYGIVTAWKVTDLKHTNQDWQTWHSEDKRGVTYNDETTADTEYTIKSAQDARTLLSGVQFNTWVYQISISDDETDEVLVFINGSLRAAIAGGNDLTDPAAWTVRVGSGGAAAKAFVGRHRGAVFLDGSVSGASAADLFNECQRWVDHWKTLSG